jgi:hypothetical protein
MATLTQKQANSLKNLLENFKTYENSGSGKIYNIILMTNQFFKGSIFIRYEHTNSLLPQEEYDFEILEVKPDGEFIKIQNNFKNVYERYSFLGECIPFEQSDITIEN